MKIAIHKREGSFSDGWIVYCESNNMSYKIVNCYDSDIISQLEDCDGLMWHWAHWDYKAVLFARQLTYSLEQSGKKVFPNSKTCWHFDDKLGQKYLFESLGFNTVPTWSFYDKKTALNWVKDTKFPKVFKLRGGASSVNVKLVKTPAQANKLVKKAFGKGFKVEDSWNSFKDRIIRFKKDKTFSSGVHLLKGIFRFFSPNLDSKMQNREKGYIYFQEFIPNNDSDIRVIIIGDRAFALKRIIRENDFRASGSGKIEYKKNEIPIECVKLAFDYQNKLKTQSVAFDFLLKDGEWVIIEVSYAFAHKAYEPCPGYWDKNLNWIEGDFKSEIFMIEDFISNIID